MIEGGCYCGEIRYRFEGKPLWQAQCHCRVCQYVSGGGPNYFMLIPPEGFGYTRGTPKQFTNPKLEIARTRDFCPTCGVHILTRLPDRPQLVLKVGTLDDFAAYGGPQAAIHCAEAAHFHQVAEGVTTFDTLPPR